MRCSYDNPFETWSRWFAWHPVWIGYTMIWWEPVERKLRMYGYDPVWEYRTCAKS